MDGGLAGDSVAPSRPLLAWLRVEGLWWLWRVLVGGWE